MRKNWRADLEMIFQICWKRQFPALSSGTTQKTRSGTMYKQRDLVLVPFPFSDLRETKRRPVLVLSNDEYNERSEDVVVAAITSNLEKKKFAIPIENGDMEGGSLPLVSQVRADKIYSISKDMVIKRFGRLSLNRYKKVVEKIMELVS
ncbi:MAG: type II toxin-antitoxin system PemK/MazF family toxin [Candidatus Micrarchaeota archaeon]